MFVGPARAEAMLGEIKLPYGPRISIALGNRVGIWVGDPDARAIHAYAVPDWGMIKLPLVVHDVSTEEMDETPMFDGNPKMYAESCVSAVTESGEM
jgi:hypothetical protein